MVKIGKRLKPPFLKADKVDDGDLLTIVEPPYIQDADSSKYGKKRTVVTVRLNRTKTVFRWGLNNTTSDRLVDAFGEDGDSWMNKELQVQKRLENVRGVDRHVLYATPLKQQTVT